MTNMKIMRSTTPELTSSTVLMTDIFNNAPALHCFYLVASPSPPCAGTTLDKIVLIYVTGGGAAMGRAVRVPASVASLNRGKANANPHKSICAYKFRDTERQLGK